MTKRYALPGLPVLLALLAPAAQAQNTARADQAKQVRVDAAQTQRNHPLPVHQNNLDEAIYAPERFANYSKGLPHNTLGEPNTVQYDALLQALLAGGNTEGVVLGGERRFVNPQAGFSFVLAGPDSQAITMVPAPKFESDEVSGEMEELYWMSLVRDVRFDQYTSNATVAQAAARLGAVREYRGARNLATGQVTTDLVFRADTRGARQGPWLSQFLIKDVPYGGGPLATPTDANPALVDPTGVQVVIQRNLTRPPGDDRVTAYTEWLSIQNGALPADPTDTLQDFDATRRHIRNGRDLAELVHSDYPIQAPLNAALLLSRETDFQSNGKYDPDPKASTPGYTILNPYRSYTTQEPFVTFGNSDVQSLVGLVSNTVLRAQWFQKWQVHRRLRPEEYAGRVHNTLTNAASYPVPEELMNSPVLPLVLARTAARNAERGLGSAGTYLLPQAFPEGSPLHPAYGSGHSTYMGAGVAVLKAFFDNAPIRLPQVPNTDGTALVPYSGTLMLHDELDKLAANIGVARLFAGVHYRSDHDNAVRLGELAALRTLVDWTRQYPETFPGFNAQPINAEVPLFLNASTQLPNAVSKVVGFAVVDAVTGTHAQTLVNGSVVDLSTLASLGYTQLEIRATVAPANVVESVRFYYDNEPWEPDDTAPYEIGDTVSVNNESVFALTVGTHVLRCLPFSQNDADGLSGVPLTLRFTVQN
ncbi:hypothetical protein ACLESD_00395 [Pyxidicoccus sp. 3LFB2]